MRSMLPEDVMRMCMRESTIVITSSTPPGDADAIYARAAKYTAFGVDTEGLDERTGACITVQVATEDFVIVQECSLESPYVPSGLKTILESGAHLKAFFDSTEDLRKLRALGIRTEKYIDLQTLTATSRDVRQHSLIAGWRRVCPRDSWMYGIDKLSFGARGFLRLELKNMISDTEFVAYAAADGWLTYMLLRMFLYDRLSRGKLPRDITVYQTIERISDPWLREKYMQTLDRNMSLHAIPTFFESEFFDQVRISARNRRLGHDRRARDPLLFCAGRGPRGHPQLPCTS